MIPTEASGTFETPTCDSCGCEASRILYSFDVGDKEVGIVRCNDCGAVYLAPRPCKEEIGRYYPATYYSYEKPDQAPPPRPSFKQRLRNSLFREVLGYKNLSRDECSGLPGWLVRRLGLPVSFPPFRPGGRLLDIGCGSGERLLEFRRLGWRVTGLEISAGAAEIARSLGLDVFVGDLADAPWPDGSFDAITLYHVLEHVHQPSAYLARITRLLSPEGVLLIAVPNFQSWERKGFRERWTWLDVPIHLHHFEAARLRKLVEAAGLRTRDVWFTSAGHSFEQSLEKTRLRSAYGLLKRLRLAKPVVATFKIFANKCRAGSGVTLIAERATSDDRRA